VSQLEQLVLDSLALNDGVTFTMEAVDMTPPPELEEWVRGADSNGALLAREPLCDNRVITASLRIEQQATMDLALAKIGLIVDKLKEAQRCNMNSPPGLALTWTPADATLTAVTFRCLSGQIVGLPIDVTSGWLVKAPLIQVKLTCLPFGEGAEVASYFNESTNPGIEVSTAGYGTASSFRTNTGATLTRVTTGQRTGTACLRVVTTATATQGVDYITVSVIAGQPKTVSVWVKGNAGGEAVTLMLGDGTVGSVTSGLTLTTSYQQMTVTLTPVATGTTGFAVTQNTATVKTFFIDDAVIVSGSTAPTQLDGDMGTGYAWTGTTGLSTSAGPNAVASTNPIITLELTAVPGDVPALGRLVITDAATQARRYIPWGLESRRYPTSSPPSLILDSASMATSGFAGATGTVSGAYSGASNNVIVLTMRTQLQALCGFGNLSHVGSFRPQLRCYANSTQIALRLTYQVGEGPFRSLPYKVPVVVGWNSIDLGEITIPPTLLGTQKWTGRIEAYSTATGGELLSVDAIWFMPSEQYGRAVATYAYSPGLLVARDDFGSRTAGVALNTTAMQAGAGTWATSGSATDLVAADAPAVTDETMTRSTTADAGPRYAIAGSATPSDIEVGVDTIRTASGISAVLQQLLIARWTDSTHYLSFSLQHFGGFNTSAWQITYWNGTQSAGLASGAATFPLNSVIGMRMVVYASGAGHAWVVLNGVDFTQMDFADSVLATGGALATGKSGFADYNPSVQAITRYYDNFYTATPASEPVCCYSGQSIEFRSDTTLRKDSTGVYAGPPPSYIGGRFYLPNAGGPGRKTRVAALARRNNVETSPDDQIADMTVMQVNYTPRFLVVKDV
jgi:hypothetical protein